MDRAAFNAMLAQYATPEVSGNGRVSWDKGVRCVIPEVKLYGKCEQDGTPTPDAPVEIRCNNGVFVARGSNLVDMPDIVSQAYSVDVKSYIQWYIDLPVGTAVTVSADAYTPQGAGGKASAWRIVLNDKTRIDLWAGYTNAEKRVSYTHTKTVDFAISDVSYSLWYLGYGVGEYDRWAKNITVNIGDTDLGYTPYYDGGQAMAPELYAIPGTEYRDEWDAQTGKGVRRCAIIESYAGETITTPYISSTGELSDGATVVYGIPDTPFYATPARLTMPPGAGQIIQVGGDVADCPITARYLTHS